MSLPSFEQIEDVAKKLRVVIFQVDTGFKSFKPYTNGDVFDNSAPVRWFMEYYAKADYKNMFNMWRDGMASMHGKHLKKRARNGALSVYNIPLMKMA